MKHFYPILFSLTILALAGSVHLASAQIPARISYQGLLLDEPGTTLSDGTYLVTFRFYDQEKGGERLWEEIQAIEVRDGLFSIFLGEQKNLDLPFDKPYWLSIEVEGQAESLPMPLSASPYSLSARSLADGAIVAGPGIEISRAGQQLYVALDEEIYSALQSLAAGTPAGLAGIASPGVGSDVGLDAAYDLGNVITADMSAVKIETLVGSTNIPLRIESNGTGPIFQGHGSDGGGREILIDDDGSIHMHSSKASNQRTVYLRPNGRGSGGELLLYDEGLSKAMVELQADGSGIGAEFRLYLKSGISGRRKVVQFLADGAGTGGEMRLFAFNSGTLTKTIQLAADGPNDSGLLRLYRKGSAVPTIEMVAGESASQGSSVYLRNAAGDITIELDAEFGGDGRVITEELEITGGSDFSENFDITGNFGIVEPLPGMVVTIDPDHPGRLTVSGRAYDRMVAGVVSGAGGIETGLIMGQSGSIADGDFPVALTGRVYVYVDAAYGTVEPGDLLTTSATPGHAMKVNDYAKSQGAVLGKAMTGLSEGRGLVLMLVSLQ